MNNKQRYHQATEKYFLAVARGLPNDECARLRDDYIQASNRYYSPLKRKLEELREKHREENKE